MTSGVSRIVILEKVIAISPFLTLFSRFAIIHIMPNRFHIYQTCVGILFAFQIQMPSHAAASQVDKDNEKLLAPAQKLLKEGQLESCEQQLHTILLANSGNLMARKMHADVLYQLNRFHYAADEVKEVLKSTPQDASAILLMGKIAQSIHKPAMAIDYYNKYLQLAPLDNTAQQYALLVNVLKDELQSQSEKHAKGRKQLGNYLAAVTGGAVMRWKEPATIRVYVKDGTGVDSYRPEFEESLRQAFDDWNIATDGKIGFEFLSDPANAQMIVTWTSDLHSPALKAEAGLAKTSYGANGLEKADILLLTVDPFKEGPIQKNYLYNICLHEIGHSLGLQGHSPYPEDIMSPSLLTQLGLSDRDVNTVLTLYSDSTNEESLSDKDEYGRPLSPAVKADRLVNAGTTAAMAGQYKKAIEKLEAALAINPNIELAKKNLAVAANNFAIAEGTDATLVPGLLRLSLFWDQKNDAARSNLNSRLEQSGVDPKSFAARVKLGDKCLSDKDPKGATVEYREALTIKEDPTVRKKLEAAKEDGSFEMKLPKQRI